MKLKICFTGKLNELSRDDAINIATKKNFLATKHMVTKDTTYLVVGNIKRITRKIIKAKEYGVEILDESDFLQMMGVSVQKNLWSVDSKYDFGN